MAGFGKAFDEAFKPASSAAIAGTLDLIKTKIVEDQKKAEESAQATTINHAAIAAAIASGNKDLMKNTALMVDSIGNSTPEASKLIFSSIQDKIKASQTQQNQQDSYAMRSGGLQPTQPAQMNDWNKSQVESQMVGQMKQMNPDTTANSPAPVSINGQAYSPIPGFDTPAQVKQKAIQSDAKDIFQGIKEGTQQPDLTGLGRTGLAGEVRAQAAREGFNLKQATLDWTSTKEFAKSLNSQQQVNLNRALNSVQASIQPLKELSTQLDQGGFVPANRLTLNAKLNGIELDSKGMSQSQVQTATKYVTQMNLMRDELAQGFASGGVPTETGYKLADQILNPAYGKGQLGAALDQVGFNLNIRRNALTSSGPVLVGGGQQQQQNQPPAYDSKTQKLQQNSRGEYRVVPK